MTNEEKEQSGQIPPKIKLNNKQEDRAPEQEQDTKDQEKPPEAKTVAGPKSDTSRVEIPEEKSEEQAEEKSEEQAEKPQEKKSAGQDETMRVVLPRAEQVETGTFRKQTSEKPQKTIKIKRPQSAKQGEDQGKTEKKPPSDVAEAKPVDKPKDDTSRIDLSKAQASPSEEQVETAKNDTMQVVLDEASEGEESTKQEGESSQKPPRTMKINRRDISSQEGETVVSSERQGAKSDTAKLDIPDSAPSESGGKKTIRIKRPDSTQAGRGKTLKISRPQAKSAEAEPTMAEEPMMTVEEGPTRPHAIFTIAAIFTVLITGTLIYVMCAQMPFGSSWPWPEKIITEWQGSTDMI